MQLQFGSCHQSVVKLSIIVQPMGLKASLVLFIVTFISLGLLNKYFKI